MYIRRSFTVAGSGLWLLLQMLSACADEAVQFQDVPALNGSGSFGARARAQDSQRPGYVVAGDAGPGALDPSLLPPNVSLGPDGTLLCGNAPCQCNNGLDDDGDGSVDGADVECTGAIDDDESSFATGIPGDNRDPKWQDCFFDGNSGHGDDRCRYPTECLTGELSLADEACAVTQACRDNCQPRAPLGCDCFGCCSVQLPGGSRTNVRLVASCSLGRIGDAEACPSCVQNPSCGNPELPDPAQPDAGQPEPAPDAAAPAPETPDPAGPDLR